MPSLVERLVAQIEANGPLPFEDFVDAFEFFGVERLFSCVHTARHTDSMIAIAQIAVGLREERFGFDDRIGDAVEHRFGFGWCE